MSRGEVRGTRKTVVVDGNNVAHHLSPNGVPRVANLVLAQSSLVQVGLKPIVVVSAALKHKIDNPEVLQEMIAKREVIEAPRGTDDDLTVIKLAQSNNADIVSNDRFLGFINRFPLNSEMLIEKPLFLQVGETKCSLMNCERSTWSSSGRKNMR
jgi:hypothetical protein